MEIIYHKKFIKKSQNLTKQEQKKIAERLRIFGHDEFHAILNNHPLLGKYRGLRSINITGDLRAIYKKEGNLITFFIVDSHSNLYR